MEESLSVNRSGQLPEQGWQDDNIDSLPVIPARAHRNHAAHNFRPRHTIDRHEQVLEPSRPFPRALHTG